MAPATARSLQAEHPAAGVSPARMADAIRFLSLDAIAKAGEGHPGAPLGCAEIATTLFTRHLRCNPQDPLWPDRDRFVMSNGHGSMLVYSLLYLAGYADITIEEIQRFRVLGSRTHGHPEYAPQHGIEVTTGPLGQGIANAVGMAVAEARLNHEFGSDLVDHRTYALVGDGCLMEGVGQEAISLAGHLRLGKLAFLWDDNHITDDGGTDLSISEDVCARFRSTQWHVVEADGHDPEAISLALDAAHADPRPSLVACRTVIGRGLPRLEGQRGAHGGRVFPEDCDEARAARRWTAPPFLVPEDILSEWRRGVGERNRAAYQAWTDRRDALSGERRALFDRLCEGRLPDGWREGLNGYKRRVAETAPTQPGIQTSSEIVELLADTIPELLSGAPDLEGPIRFKQKLPAFTARDRGGRYLHYGVREHAMGSMMNGMVAHGGVLPIGATYLVFSDYMRPPLRMAALMRLPVITAYSHDSIGCGTNGPTHQPVEFLASLRAIPNMLVLRPADAVEAAECWAIALANRDGPASLIFSRQALPPVRQEAGTENLSSRGAYVLVEADSGPRRITLIATGSEVAVALAARDILQQKGHATAVVSLPSFELFERQDEAYRAEVLRPETVRVGIEAAIRLGWDRWIGERGGFVGMIGFGASGPGDELFRHFGITPEAVVDAALARL
jgi:transketolase